MDESASKSRIGRVRNSKKTGDARLGAAVVAECSHGEERRAKETVSGSMRGLWSDVVRLTWLELNDGEKQ